MFFEVGVLKNFPIFRGKHLYCLHKTIKFETLTQLTCFIFLLGVGEMLWGYRKCWGLGPGAGYGEGCFSRAVPVGVFVAGQAVL